MVFTSLCVIELVTTSIDVRFTIAMLNCGHSLESLSLELIGRSSTSNLVSKRVSSHTGRALFLAVNVCNGNERDLDREYSLFQNPGRRRGLTEGAAAAMTPMDDSRLWGC